MEYLQTAGIWMGWILIWLICAMGLLLSCLSISGTWLVVLAAILAALLSGPGAPGVWTVVIFAVLSVSIEIIEVLAGSWGVKRRGGSSKAGFAAFAGGIAGLFAGTFIPVPLAGSLIGMLGGSFIFAYVVERKVLLKEKEIVQPVADLSNKAADVAFGAVIARIFMIFIKIAATLGMTISLAVRVLTG